MKNAQKPILGFAAASGTGKTTLLIQLIPLLKQRGLRVGLIKHSHHNFEVDKQGKDSYRLRAAGASPVMLASSHRRAIMTEFNPSIEPQLDEQLKVFEQDDVDLILVEGFKTETFPKIELHRGSLNKPYLYLQDKNIIAVATDSDLELPEHLTRLDLNNPAQIVSFIMQRFINPQPIKSDLCSLEAKGLLSIEGALEKIKQQCQPINLSERKPLKQSLGRVLAESVYSPINLPHDRTSAMDGYAFSSADIMQKKEFILKQVGISWAGQPFVGELNTGECVRIFTGAVIPEEADSVIMQERVQIEGDLIQFPAQCSAFDHVRPSGEDLNQGDELLAAGQKLSGIDLGLLAAAGLYDVAVKRTLKIAFFSTGNELISIGKTLKTGQIYDSNRYTLAGLLSDSSFDVVDLGVISDDKKLLEETLITAAKNYDVIISTGGASVGEADFIQEVLAACGRVDFWKIAIKPGKPLAFGMIDACAFFGLPGNPVSVLVTFEKIVKPALRQLSGAKPVSVLQLQASCQSVLKKAVGRQEYQRGILTQQSAGCFKVISAGFQGSNILSASSRANCYIVLPIACTGVKIGDLVTVEPFDVFI